MIKRSFQSGSDGALMGGLVMERNAHMPVFMVERDLKGISMDALGAAQKAAIGKANEMSSAGTSIRYIRSTFAPDDERCMCLFEAASDTDVKRLKRRSQAALQSRGKGTRSHALRQRRLTS